MIHIFRGWARWINDPKNEKVVGAFIVLFGTFEIIAVGLTMWALASYGAGVGVFGTFLVLTGAALLLSLILVS